MFSCNNLFRDAEYDNLLYSNLPHVDAHNDEESLESSDSSSCIDDFPTQAEVDSERPVELLPDVTYFV
ncbi:hypothetical protein TVAG_034740 [Trichomonas vaginalis G3]|uniref:Uncharacterized protein n=1 Tax=Trichomonas vaginalis (strain ATCC PRA-98 / G3) TaxID=412133 RepID=A2FJ84_TRIV3|nr:hypothetical protein TVAGG3_0440820 [Trichomonas vaginalis G3]EAX95045.1 hypothetical protein TVAG_034740 [Trichomonas vaginalis G3]KAI5537446.1 hypothetical protein TVAGG3_0440820 [Trichomonas vaginalis G3]|eukprot:XP_001307975.1 hypothetical protein [Trichomonas vaginalis G3]